MLESGSINMNSNKQTVLMEKSRMLFQRSKQVSPGGVHSPVRAFKSVGGEPIFFERSEGPYLHSVDGQKFIDFCQAFGPLLLGHRDPEVLESVEEMLHTAWGMGACEPYSLELAEWITSRLPFIEAIRFVNSGTEAVMSALRVARAATGRQKILKFDGCYHGHVDSMLVKAGSGLAGAVASDSAGVSDKQETLVAQLNDIESVKAVFAQNPDTIAAVIIEPLPANFGLMIQNPDFIKAMMVEAKKYGALVIFDEVISGFRVALGGMAELLGVKPDLCTYGKIIGGGFPVGAFGGRRELMDLVAPQGPVYQAGTLSANPVSTRAGLATLQKIERENVYQVLDQRIEGFTSELSRLFKKFSIPYSISRYQSIFWIHEGEANGIRSLKDIPQKFRESFPKFFHSALRHGIYLPPSAYEVEFVGFAHTEEVLGQALYRFEHAMSQIGYHDL